MIHGSVLLETSGLSPIILRFKHRTETVDYAILLSGELDRELDEGEVVHLTPGDIVVQRGTIHTWVNRGSVPAVTAFILIHAKPVEVNGGGAGHIFPGVMRRNEVPRT